MGLIVVAADKGAPGVTTTALALAAVWPRAVLLAECDPAGGDLAYRFPAAGGERLDPRRGMLSLAVAARHGLQPGQVWEHTQKLYGGMDVLLGVTNAEQGTSLSMLWGQLGRVLAGVPQADVIADCGRLGADGPLIDLLAEASEVLLLTRAEMGEVIRLRDRALALAAAVEKRGRRGFTADVVVIADQKNFKAELAEVAHALSQGRAPVRVVGGIVSDSRAAGLLRGHWGGKLDKSLLIRSVRGIAGQLVAVMPPQQAASDQRPSYERPAAQPAPAQPSPAQHASGQHASGQQADAEHAGGSYAQGQTPSPQYVPGHPPNGQYTAGQYVNGQYVNGQYVNGQYASGQPGSGQPGSGQPASGGQGTSQPAPVRHPPGQRAPRHRYAADGRPASGTEPRPDGGGAPGQTPQAPPVPQYRGR